jgi:hypothetical protein
MTDDVGLLQHATYSTPNRRHGYATDDNARALIAAVVMSERSEDEPIASALQTYLAFLIHARCETTGRFRNFLSYDRRWLDDDGGDDCQGRTIWALGELTARRPIGVSLRLAEGLFRDARELLPTIRSIRGRAFTVLALDAWLRRHRRDGEIRSLLGRLADGIADEFPCPGADGWPWYEDIVTYDNARLPEALIVAGDRLDREDLVARGVRLLRWLLDIQTAPEGCLSFIGNDGWLRRGGRRPRFDQQPLEAAALVGACRAAFLATGDPDWLWEMRRSFDWFLGRNEHGLPLIDPETHACCDGLTPAGVNANQGAESTLSWLLSVLILHEMNEAGHSERPPVTAPSKPTTVASVG